MGDGTQIMTLILRGRPRDRCSVRKGCRSQVPVRVPVDRGMR